MFPAPDAGNDAAAAKTVVAPDGLPFAAGNWSSTKSPFKSHPEPVPSFLISLYASGWGRFNQIYVITLS